MGQRQKIPIFFSFGLASAHRARAKYRLAVCLRKYSNGIETKPVMFAHLPAVEGVGGGAGKCAFFFLGGSGIKTAKEPEKISTRTLFWVESGQIKKHFEIIAFRVSIIMKK